MMIQAIYIFFFTPSNSEASISNPNGPNIDIKTNNMQAVIRVTRLIKIVKITLKNSWRISFGKNNIISFL